MQCTRLLNKCIGTTLKSTTYNRSLLSILVESSTRTWSTTLIYSHYSAMTTGPSLRRGTLKMKSSGNKRSRGSQAGSTFTFQASPELVFNKPTCMGLHVLDAALGAGTPGCSHLLAQYEQEIRCIRNFAARAAD